MHAYPLPLIDEVHGLQSSASWDLQCGYWHVPVDPKDHAREDTFSPGSGMGLYQFIRMPFV